MMQFVQFVENQLSNESFDKASSAAIRSFLGVCHRYLKSDADGSLTDVLRIWAVAMAIHGISVATRGRYFGKVRALYREWKTGPDDKPFEQTFPLIESLPVADNTIPERDLESIQTIISLTDDDPEFETSRAMLLLLFNPGLRPREVIDMDFDDRQPELPQIADIIEAMRRTSRRRYIFGLGQGRIREPQIMRELTRRVGRLFPARVGGSLNSVKAIWIAAALRERIPLTEIRAVVDPVPEEYAPLKSLPRIEISDNRRLEILRTVADSISDNTVRWFVMRLRKGQTPEGIIRAIGDELPELAGKISYYHPTRTIIRTPRGKRPKREDVEMLPGILFFRTRRDHIKKIFARIGDRAWCYRTAHRPNAPYSTISQSDMIEFQRHIGQFTADVNIQLIENDAPLAIGDEVKILGGIFAGKIGRIETATTTTTQGVTTHHYQLRLSDQTAFHWTLTLPAPQLEPTLPTK